MKAKKTIKGAVQQREKGSFSTVLIGNLSVSSSFLMSNIWRSTKIDLLFNFFVFLLSAYGA